MARTPIKSRHLILGAIMAAGLFLRFRALSERPLWFDEQLQLRDLSKPIGDMVLQRPPQTPEGFVGDFVLTWPLAQVSQNKWVLMIPHVILTLAGFYFFYRIILGELNSVTAQAAALLLFCLNRNAIFHSFELRPYSVLITLAIVLYWFIPKWLNHQKMSNAEKVCCSAFLFCVFLFHAYSALIFSVVFIHHLWALRRNEILPGGLGIAYRPFIVAGCCALPLWSYYAWILMHYGQFGRHTFEYVHPTLFSLISFWFGNLGDLQVRGLWVVPLMAAGAGFFARDSGRIERAGMFVGLIALPIAIITAMDIHSGYWLLPRQFVWAVPFWSLLVGLSVDGLMP